MDDNEFVTIVHPKVGESEVLWESVDVWERRGWSVKKDSTPKPVQKPVTETTSKENVEQSNQTSVAPAPLSISAKQED